MSEIKLVIPCAGTGSRLENLTDSINKALLTLGNLPVIAHILKQFPDEMEVVIPLGFSGDHISQVLRVMFPRRVFHFVYVDNYSGPGSGLGYTLSKVKKLLQCPFIFTPNDTLIQFEKIDYMQTSSYNWAAYYVKKSGDEVPQSEYRTVEITNNVITRVNPKGLDSNNIYLGITGIYDYKNFWDQMDDPRSIEIGEAFGLNGLNRVHAISVQNWYDTGNIKSLRKAKKEFKDDEFNILEKTDEAIWFHDDKVFKFHIDQEFIRDRVKRLEFLPKRVMPEVLFSDKNLYCYKKVKGTVFSKVINPENFSDLMNQAQKEIWSKSPKKITKEATKRALTNFYKNKTVSRVDEFIKKFEINDQNIKINSRLCPSVYTQLDRVNWEKLYDNAILANFHGDFHSENILFSNGKITLIDWRQNFGELGYELGDVYYDLSKMLHGLIVSHEQIDRDNYALLWISDVEIRLELSQNFCNVECISLMKIWCRENNYDFKQVELLTSLIFLNICAMHHHPYSEFLFYLGRYLLQEALTE